MRFNIYIILLFFISSSGFCQHISIEKKELQFLKAIDTINVTFNFENTLYDGPEQVEDKFLKIAKEAITDGHGAPYFKEWLYKFYNSKRDLYPVTFISVLNKKLSEYKNPPFFVIDKSGTDYTMKVTVAWMYFGYDIEIIDRPSKVTLDIEFIKNEKPNLLLSTTQIKRAMGTYNSKKDDGEGGGPSFLRMNKAYYTAGYKLAKALKRIVD
ncbi:hypothetical protein ULMS_12580 [Patiriisocius marinistellae]|uniref:Uncharacterized protein n=1 Tax=Patiriisocius marinistellae TaxID=2494560 RepID=A0A5J4FUY9_9FLAO|nr:hypothetical protein [Patiriisocius marinistellae]GEQ85750.1 hypothetical protein ULMS_12580 [Patiriisocius marinistellae]